MALELHDTHDPDNATVTITAGTKDVMLKVRIPGWATHATLNGRPAANGTLVAVPCAAGRTATATVELNPQVVVERGWGSLDRQAGSPVPFPGQAGATVPVPTADYTADLELGAGAALQGSRQAGYEDLRTDFDARQTRLGDGALVHAGFYRAWRAVRGDVRRAIDAAAGGREATVCYTGQETEQTPPAPWFRARPQARTNTKAARMARADAHAPARAAASVVSSLPGSHLHHPT